MSHPPNPRREEAPVFIRAFDLHSWLLGRLDTEGKYPTARRAALDASRDLLENVALALAGHGTPARTADADEAAVLLRVHLRLAREKELISERQLLYANGELRDIGRQLGGWRKKLGAIG